MTAEGMTPEKARALLEATTPGPWYVLNSRDVFSAVVSNTSMVAMDFAVDADAELTAAAPDLAAAYLAACKERDQAKADGWDEGVEAVQSVVMWGQTVDPTNPYR